ATAEARERTSGLRLTLRGAVRPDLRRHDRPVTTPLERPTQDAFGLSVHRRAVEEVRANLKGFVHPVGRDLFLTAASHVEGPPGADTDGRNGESAAPERSAFHVGSGRQPLDDPAALGIPRVSEPVVETILAALPELE